MELKHIKETSCPVCGCAIVIRESIEVFDGKIRAHANGKRWEHRQFLCGQELQYIPNFGRTEVDIYNICKNNETYKTMEKNREEAKKELHKHIDSLNVTDNVKKSWKGWIY